MNPRRGETLRGLLLYAWGWSLVGTIAFWVANAALLGALVVLAAMVYSLIHTAEGGRLSVTTLTRQSGTEY